MQVTDIALDQIKKTGCLLKILIDIGGCRGFKFSFEYIKEYDHCEFVRLNNFILVEKHNLSILKNFELDYISEFGYEDFILHPLSQYKSCGCGVSFG